MKYLIVFISLIITLFACNRSAESEPDIANKSIKEENYPKEIRDKHLGSLYDKSKWSIYCIHSDEYCRFYKKLNIVEKPHFGSLDLRFDKVEYFNDTTEIEFSFYYKDTIRCDVNTVYNHGTLTSGAAFKGNNDSIIYFLSRTTVNRFFEKGITSRYDNPLQPEVITFIKNNKNKLNPWFREEAKRRKIIE